MTIMDLEIVKTIKLSKYNNHYHSFESTVKYFKNIHWWKKHWLKTAHYRKVNQYLLSEHAVLRWNERVTPIYKFTSERLNLLINNINQLKRILFLSNGVGVIDYDIIFTYSKVSEKILITTFYGRCSENPSLYQFDTLKTYNRVSDKINMSVNHDFAMIPPIPAARIVIDYNGNYVIDKYILKNSIIYHVVINYSMGGKALRREQFFSNDEIKNNLKDDKISSIIESI